jgi:hypothetical protein
VKPSHLIIAGFIIGAAFGVVTSTSSWTVGGEGPPAVAAPGTVERRLHLTLATPWDSDKRRAFVCREAER